MNKYNNDITNFIKIKIIIILNNNNIIYDIQYFISKYFNMIQ
jgi:hypothetical protein